MRRPRAGGTGLFNIGDSGDAFGVANDTDVAVLDILLATNTTTVNGILYDLDGDAAINTVEQALRAMANEVYNAVYEEGNI